MSNKSLNEALIAGITGVFFGIIIFELIEEENRQQSRMQNLRKKLRENNGLESDANRINEDWGQVGKHLRSASEKEFKKYTTL